MSRGLAFISFARTTTTQFEFIFRAWPRNPNFPTENAGADRLLFSLLPETVLCGGYYFLPSIHRRAEPCTWFLPSLD